MNGVGIRLVGINGENATKLLLTVGALVVVLGLRAALSWAIGHLRKSREPVQTGEHTRFLARQGVSLAAAILLLVSLVSIWFDDPARFATFAALISAGVAVALQRVVTSFAAYLIILRGRVFTVGDRITMGGVRGDVVDLGFMQTSVMEMGQPPSVRSNDPVIWVNARQYTGGIVRVTNDKIFDSPVYNYTREFPYLWEEIHIPLKYEDDRQRVEEILLESARRHTADLVPHAAAALRELEHHYFLPERPTLEPRVYYRLTDNWLELTLRFISHEHGVRRIKDAMSRDILGALDDAGIGIASATYDVVGMPPLRLELSGPAINGANRLGGSLK